MASARQAVILDSTGQLQVVALDPSLLVTLPATPQGPAILSPPQIPPVIVDRTVQVTSTVIDPKDLQSAIDNTASGDILVKAGASATGNFLLRNRKTDDVVRIISSGKLPPEHVRTDAVRDRAEMFTLLSANEYAVLENDTDLSHASACAAHHYVIEGAEIAPAPSNRNIYDLVAFRNEKAFDYPDLPHNIELRHCNIHSFAGCNTARGFWPGGTNLLIADSLIEDIVSNFMEANAIGSDDCPGPLTIRNCRLIASAENVILGSRDDTNNDGPYAAMSLLDRFVPTDIRLEYNHCMKRPEWRASATMAGVSFKNPLEFKMGQYIVLVGNLLEYSWVAAQAGSGLLLTPRSNAGRAFWSVVSDVFGRDNIIKNCAQGIVIARFDNRDGGHPERLERSGHIMFVNTLIDTSLAWTPGPTDNRNIAMIMQDPIDVTLDRMTIRSEYFGPTIDNWTLTTPFQPAPGFKLTNSMISAPHPMSAAGTEGPELMGGGDLTGTRFDGAKCIWQKGTRDAWTKAWPNVWDAPGQGCGADMARLALIEAAVRSGDIRALMVGK